MNEGKVLISTQTADDAFSMRPQKMFVAAKNNLTIFDEILTDKKHTLENI